MNELPKLIVSCQIRPGQPLCFSAYIKALIKIMKLNNISLVRVDGKYINSARKNGLQVIALEKSSDADRYITSTKKSAERLAKKLPNYIAIEATETLHTSDEYLLEIISAIKAVSPKIEIIADIATHKEAERANKLGIDYVATTFSRVASRGGKCKNHRDHVALIKKITSNKIKVLAEGLITTPDEARELLDAGALSVVIGAHITNPLVITKYFYDSIKFGR